MKKSDVTVVFKGADDASWQELLDDLRPKGRWGIKIDKYGESYICPFCNKEVSGTDLNFCVKCGADLRGVPVLDGEFLITHV